MAIGRETLELFLDAAPAVRAARAIDDAVEAIGRGAATAAARFDSAFDSAFDRVRRSAAEAGRHIRAQFSDLGRSLNLGGIFGVSVGTLIGNLISHAVSGIMGAFDRLADASRSFVERAVSEARQAADAYRFLASAVRETGGDFESASEQAREFARAFGTTEASAARLFAQAGLQLQQAGTPVSADRYLRSFADAAAARGRTIDELPELISGLFTDDATSDKILGQNPSGIYETYAASVNKTVAALSELEKKQALVNAVVNVGAENVGRSSERLESFGGILEQISSLTSDLLARVGDALGRSQGARQFVEGIRDSLVKLLDDEQAFERFFLNLVRGAQGVLRAIVPVAAQVARVVVEVLRGLGGSETWDELQRSTLTFFHLIDGQITALKATVVEAAGEVVAFILNAIAASSSTLALLIGDAGEQVKQRLKTDAEGIRAEGARRQEERRAEIGKMTEKIVAADTPFRVLDSAINEVERSILDAVNALDKIDQPAAKVDAVADAAGRARAEFSNLKREIEAAVEQAGKFTDERFKSLTALSDVRQRRGDLERSTLQVVGFQKGFYGQTTQDPILGFVPPTETKPEALDRFMRDVFFPMLAGAQGAGSGELTFSLSGDTLEAVRAAGEANAASEEALERADRQLYDALQRFDPALLQASGFADEALEVTRRVEAREAAREKELRDKQKTVLEKTEANQDRLNKLYEEVKKGGVDLPELGAFIAKLAKDGIIAKIFATITADRQFEASVADGEAGDRLASAGA